MELAKGYHLTYCTNIHPGETWEEVFISLKEYLPSLKKKLSSDQPFGIGLRLSNQASEDILKKDQLQEFKVWLQQEGLYVFTINGFPYGGFHHQEVKDNVHKPDWTTDLRVAYTCRLATILAELLPEGMEGGISTSPLSYKPWFFDADDFKVTSVYTSCTNNLLQVVEYLLELKDKTGKTIHIDIEPEPDGFLENSKEVIALYTDRLLPKGIKRLQQNRGLLEAEAREAILEHVQLCYDVCHFALAYEKPSEVFAKLQEAGIKTGKIQLSAALKTSLPEDAETRGDIASALTALAESTYLHQVVERSSDGELTSYPDLTFALQHIRKPNAVEWRTHFHVPLFTRAYNGLQSTQDDVREVLKLLQQQPLTQHLEVETYTWEVLPEEIKKDLPESIKRELEWVLKSIKPAHNAEDSSSERSRAHKVANR
ncbi:hypothetical protein ABID22_003252 [Pontibacter aydingkolensis]|uniref:Metabolite traffic protein EboE n=1 Tax=Pontibacter aydingkolensis TaxID=1911536 RepID=A0ABS7CS64_9BACT|nr:metabolite traffic protein EboE [Pontibacter aydingkolensis]MBW7466670.1 metabolite traffic protein EboE [Pontibacter aydingkolensis]